MQLQSCVGNGSTFAVCVGLSRTTYVIKKYRFYSSLTLIGSLCSRAYAETRLILRLYICGSLQTQLVVGLNRRKDVILCRTVINRNLICCGTEKTQLCKSD